MAVDTPEIRLYGAIITAKAELLIEALDAGLSASYQRKELALWMGDILGDSPRAILRRIDRAITQMRLEPNL